MEGKDEIQELFSQKLGNYEAKVDPSLWNGVASQLGTTAATAASTGMSLLTKVIIGASISVAVITTTIFVLPSDTEPSAEQSSIASNNKNTESEESVSNQIQNPVTQITTDDSDPSEASNDNDVEEIGAASEEIEDVFEMPITEFPEQLIEEDCIDCDLVERSEETEKESTTEKEEVSGEEKEEVVIEREEVSEKEVKEIPVPKPVYYIEQYTNVFSPNGDGNNDIFSLKIQGLTEFKISILDFNDGKELFESRDVNFTWDGTDKAGNQVKEGDFIFIITALDFDENPVREIKSLTIAR